VSGRRGDGGEATDGATSARAISWSRAGDDERVGEEFGLVGDRDPTAVRSLLASLADDVDDPADLAPFAVERLNHETWLLETERP